MKIFDLNKRFTIKIILNVIVTNSLGTANFSKKSNKTSFSIKKIKTNNYIFLLYLYRKFLLIIFEKKN